MYVLTREDARHRSTVVTVRHIDVTLHLEEAASEKSSYRVLSRMTLVSQEPTLFVDVAGEVQTVSIDDVPLASDQFTYDGERLDISGLPLKLIVAFRRRGRGCIAITIPRMDATTFTRNLSLKMPTARGPASINLI